MTKRNLSAKATDNRILSGSIRHITVSLMNDGEQYATAELMSDRDTLTLVTICNDGASRGRKGTKEERELALATARDNELKRQAEELRAQIAAKEEAEIIQAFYDNE